jgi:hypothetical protein
MNADDRPGKPLEPPRLQVGCFLSDGLLRCETTNVGDEVVRAKPSRPQEGGKGRRKGSSEEDPSRSPDSLKKSEPSKRDEESEIALAARMPRSREDTVRLRTEAEAALGFPDPPRFGALIQGSDRPPPDMGKQWQQSDSNQLLSSKNVGLAAKPGGAAEKKLSPKPRVVPPVPTVASMMYSN